MNATNLFGVFLIIVNLFSAFAIASQIRLTYQRKNIIGLARLPWFMGTTNAFFGLILYLWVVVRDRESPSKGNTKPPQGELALRIITSLTWGVAAT